MLFISILKIVFIALCFFFYHMVIHEDGWPEDPTVLYINNHIYIYSLYLRYAHKYMQIHINWMHIQS
jgi:hypothetical protein